MLRLAQDIFAHPGISTKRALAFIGYAEFYAAVGTLFASLMAWSMILIVSIGIVLMPSIGRMIDDPDSVLHAGTAVVLGGTALRSWRRVQSAMPSRHSSVRGSDGSRRLRSRSSWLWYGIDPVPGDMPCISPLPLARSERSSLRPHHSVSKAARV
jgi:hypothetical protein